MKITSTKAKRSAATITFGGGSRNVCQTNTACISVMVTNAKKKSTSTIMMQSSRRKFGICVQVIFHHGRLLRQHSLVEYDVVYVGQSITVYSTILFFDCKFTNSKTQRFVKWPTYLQAH